MAILPPVFWAFLRYGAATLCGYLPAFYLLSSWRWPGVFFVTFLLFLPFPIALTIHLLHLTAEPIPFYWQCGFLGCTTGSAYFFAKRQGWTKTW